METREMVHPAMGLRLGRVEFRLCPEAARAVQEGHGVMVDSQEVEILVDGKPIDWAFISEAVITIRAKDPVRVDLSFNPAIS